MNTPNVSKARWVMEAPVLNLEHLTESTKQALCVSKAGFCNDLGILTVPMLEGFLTFCSDPDEMEALPPDLRACLQWALKNGYEWVRFDVQGDVMASLPWHGREPWEGRIAA